MEMKMTNKEIREINDHYAAGLEYEEQQCEFSEMNAQCIGQRCPFFVG